MANLVAQAAVGASTGSASQPQLGEGETEQKKTCCQKFCQWFCSNPLTNLPILLLFVAGGVCMAGGIVHWHIVVAVLGFLALSAGGYQVWTLRNLKEQVDRFSKENAKLEVTERQLQTQVSFLQTQKDKLEGQVGKLKTTVVEMRDVSNGLEKELDGFQKLKGNFERFANEAGHDVSQVLENADRIYSKMQENAINNERETLSKIAQDLEFLDKDAGMTKKEFQKWVERVPKDMKETYRQQGITFEAVAGADGLVDYMEIEGLINRLLAENEKKNE